MKRNFFLLIILLLGLTQGVFALPKVHIIATGGTIAGKTTNIGYSAAEVYIEDLLKTIPELGSIAELDFEQFSNIGSQDMNETLWLSLSKRVNEVLKSNKYDGVVITHGTDVMEETAYFLNLTLKSDRPVVLVGSMLPSDAPNADGPGNLIVAVQNAADKNNIGKEVMCCLNKTIYYASGVYKNNSHVVDAFASIQPDYQMPHNASSGFDISKVETLPKVGIVYCYGGNYELPLQSFIDAKYDGVVLVGVGFGNLSASVQTIAEKAAKNGMKIVRSTRCPFGGVYTEGGEVDDEKLGFIPSGSLNAQKARILLMLALTNTKNTKTIRSYFKNPIKTPPAKK